MPSDNLSKYILLARDTAQQLSWNQDLWAAFLRTAARLYKYPFQEQLLIFAQRPGATACADYETWNKRMRRYVRRGGYGIALIDESGDNPRLKYVFDVADTRGGPNSLYPYLWSLQPEHLPAASDALAQRFGVGADDGEGAFLSQLRDAVLVQVKNYWENNSLDILRSVDNSLLSDYDESEIRSVFLTAAVESTAYLTEMRCGLRQSTGFDPAAFHRVTEFNTSPSIHALGKAINETGAQILRTIEAAVKAYERQKSAERSKYNERDEGHQLLREADGRERHDDPSGERSELSQGGRRLDSRSDFGTGGGAGRPSHLPLGEPEKGLSEGASSDHLYDHAPGGNPLEAHEGRERVSTGAQGANDPRNGEAAGRDRGAETDRPNEVGRLDEQHQGQRGGNHLRGADLRLSSEPTEQPLSVAPAAVPVEEADATTPIVGQQLGLFPTEAEQLHIIQEAESVANAPSAFAFSQADIDAALRHGSGFAGGKLRIYGFYRHKPNSNEAIDFLKKEYGYYGRSHTFLDGSSGFVDYSPAGMTLRHYAPNYEKKLKWNAVDKRLRQLIAEGSYLSDAEQAQNRERALGSLIERTIT